MADNGTVLFHSDRSFVAKVKGEPISMGEDAIGNPVINMKIPGYDRMSFTPEGLDAMNELLTSRPVEGAEAHQVAQRTASFDADGNLSFRLSDSARSRTLTLTSNEQADFAELFRAIRNKLRMVLAEQKAKADAEAALKGESDLTDPE